MEQGLCHQTDNVQTDGIAFPSRKDYVYTAIGQYGLCCGRARTTAKPKTVDIARQLQFRSNLPVAHPLKHHKSMLTTQGLVILFFKPERMLPCSGPQRRKSLSLYVF
jgi:hypothetical protein